MREEDKGLQGEDGELETRRAPPIALALLRLSGMEPRT